MFKLRRKYFTETKEIVLIIDSEMENSLICPVCNELIRMVSPLLAAKLFNISTREIYKWIELDLVHFTEFEDKQVLLCMKSIDQTRLKFPLLPPIFDSS
jgi:hypothetical protein